MAQLQEPCTSLTNRFCILVVYMHSCSSLILELSKNMVVATMFTYFLSFDFLSYLPSFRFVLIFMISVYICVNCFGLISNYLILLIYSSFMFFACVLFYCVFLSRLTSCLSYPSLARGRSRNEVHMKF